MTRSFRNGALATALVCGLIVTLAPSSASSAPNAPTEQIGPGPLQKLLLTAPEVMAALPTSQPMQMVFDYCVKRSAKSGTAAHILCTQHSESEGAMDETKTHSGVVDILSFSTKAQARAALKATQKSYAAKALHEVSDVTKSSFIVVYDNPGQDILITRQAKIKGSNLVTTNCFGADLPAQASCAQALTAAQLAKLP